MDESASLKIDRIAFLGRTFDEYLKIFGLDENILREGPVLDCAAGAASFSAEARQLGIDATACDIMYGLPFERLLQKGEADLAHVFEKVREVSHLYTWKYYKDMADVVRHRKIALDLFARDFQKGYQDGRYVRCALPEVPFPDGAFNLVLSGHFLFLYGDRLDLDFHKACLKELIRVTRKEVRIFPLLGLDAKPYPYMDEIFSFLDTLRVNADLEEVHFEFFSGATRMMRIRKKF